MVCTGYIGTLGVFCFGFWVFVFWDLFVVNVWIIKQCTKARLKN